MFSIGKIAAFTIFIIAAGQSYASERLPVLVELFTSQGCSSCPPADAILGEMSKRVDVVALAFHVDYWDYIGWKDSFAHPSFSKRQKTYARLASRTAVYTPQFMVQGQESIAGSNLQELESAIARASQSKLGYKIKLGTESNHVRVTLIEALPLRRIQADVFAIYFSPQLKVAIKSGENSGRVITYSNVVTKVERIGQWDGLKAWSKTISQRPDQNVAIIVQSKGQGKVIAVSKMR